jgi:hypothetical protein
VRYLAPHAPHSVAGPPGPGFLPLHSSALQSHHAQRQAPPSQKRMWPPTDDAVSNSRAQTWHTNLPLSALSTSGPVAPPR